jgi:hypothetical protein
MEPWDRAIDLTISASAFEFLWDENGKWRTDLSMENPKLQVLVTSSRVVLFTPKIAAGDRNLLTKAITAHLAKDSVFLAQIRYEWLSHVGFKAGGIFASEELRLGFNAKENGKEIFGVLDIHLSKGMATESVFHVRTDAESLALHICVILSTAKLEYSSDGLPEALYSSVSTHECCLSFIQVWRYGWSLLRRHFQDNPPICRRIYLTKGMPSDKYAG